jgi:VanZ family protein
MSQFNLSRFGRGRFGRYAPLIFWIAVVFVLSSRAGSMSNTSLFIRPILEFLFPAYSDEQLAIIHAYVRKTAHFGLYFVLGWLAARAFYFSSKEQLKNYWFAAAFILVTVIASLDETNQSFLNSRTGSVYDVIIDAAGGATALFVFYLYGRFRAFPIKLEVENIRKL